MGCITWSYGGLYHEESSTTHTSSHLRQGGQRPGQARPISSGTSGIPDYAAQADHTTLALHIVTHSCAGYLHIRIHIPPLRPTLLYLPAATITGQQRQPIYSYSLSHSSCFSLPSLLSSHFTSKQTLYRIPFTIVSLLSFNQFTRHC